MISARGLLFVLSLFLVPTAQADFPDIVQKAKLSVVSIGTYQSTRRPQARFMGTGFVIADGLHVITNKHVLPEDINDRKKEFLAAFSGEGLRPDTRKAEVIAKDSRHDLALLKIDGVPLPTMKLGNGKTVRDGEAIAFTGFPIGMVLGLYPVTHKGSISAVTPSIEPVYHSKQLNPKLIRALRDPFMVFQLDATAYPGNSGSPMYRQADGKVIGVINKVFVKETKELVIQKPSGITYAIPVRYVKALMKKGGL